jgi:peptide/nickel transport system substrate-binding protein
VDELLSKALATVNDQQRNALLAEATEVSMEDVGIIPIFFPKNTWAAKKGLKITARTDEYTLAMSVAR